MTLPEISVLVPSYNHAPFIERTLRSIFKQTLRPKKLIVIDDGSKDESVAVIERVLKDCPFRHEFTKRENRGLSATLNEGFARADTEFFAYLGSDDIWLAEFLEKRAALLGSRPNAVLAFGHAYLIDEDDNIIESTADWGGFADGDMLPDLLRGQVFASPTVLYRSTELKKYKWNEDAVLEDYELYLQLCTEGEFALDSSILSAWRQHDSNVSGDFPLMLQQWLAAQDRTADKLGIDRAKLDEIQAILKFDSAFTYIRGGQKKDALRLMRDNIGGARSNSQIGKLLARLATPKALFVWNRDRKRAQSIARYGKLKY
jgi:alpha-1,3-rhamnosyltransferase